MKGVLLVNLGTPQAATVSAIRCYLAEFLSDCRIIEMPKWLWIGILYGLILRTRPYYLVKQYQKIWMPSGSPLLVYSKRLAEKIQDQLGTSYKVVFSMRYGKPSIQQGLAVLKNDNVQHITVLPLYPQYASATTASVFDVIVDKIKSWHFIPNLRFISHYFDHPAYISALVDSIRAHQSTSAERDYLLFSFHGLPKRHIDRGDPYEKHCYMTVKMLAEHLHLSADEYGIAFQSRFGYSPWLTPACEEVLRCLPQQDIKKLSVICPGFSVDCLETLEEIAERNKDLFLKSGGDSFCYIPALNDTQSHVDALVQIITGNC